LVSQIDDNIAEAEVNLLKDFILNQDELSQAESDSLLGFLRWCLAVPQKTTGIRQQLNQADPVVIASISRILVLVALADGRIEPSEIGALEKLYTMLGLPKDKVKSDLNAMAASSQSSSTGLIIDGDAYAMPNPEDGYTKAIGLGLSEELIRLRAEESRHVERVLGAVFEAQDEAQENDDGDMDNAENTAHSKGMLAELDQAHQTLFHHLIKSETWERKSVADIAKSLNLMMDGAIEVLNDWTIRHMDTPLIEDGEPFYIDLTLAKEILGEHK